MSNFSFCCVIQLFNMIVPGSSGRIALDDVLTASDDTLSAVSKFVTATEQKYFEKRYTEEMQMEGGGFPPEFANDDADTLTWDPSSQGVDEEMWRKKVHEQHHQDL